MNKLFFIFSFFLINVLNGSEQDELDLDKFIEVAKLDAQDGPIGSVRWSPNGKELASGSYDHTIRILDPYTLTCLRSLKSFGGSKRLLFTIAISKWPWLHSVEWSPDGTQLASGSKNNTVSLWNSKTALCICTLESHDEWVNSVSWSPDSTQLASGSGDKTIKIWDLATSECLQTLKGHDGWIFSVDWSPDGKYIASGSNDQTVRIWTQVKNASSEPHAPASGPEEEQEDVTIVEDKEEDDDEAALRRALQESQRKAEDRKLDKDKEATKGVDVSTQTLLTGYDNDQQVIQLEERLQQKDTQFEQAQQEMTRLTALLQERRNSSEQKGKELTLLQSKLESVEREKKQLSNLLQQRSSSEAQEPIVQNITHIYDHSHSPRYEGPDQRQFGGERRLLSGVEGYHEDEHGQSGRTEIHGTVEGGVRGDSVIEHVDRRQCCNNILCKFFCCHYCCRRFKESCKDIELKFGISPG